MRDPEESGTYPVVPERDDPFGVLLHRLVNVAAAVSMNISFVVEHPRTAFDESVRGDLTLAARQLVELVEAAKALGVDLRRAA